MHDSINERCFLEVTRSKTKGLKQISGSESVYCSTVTSPWWELPLVIRFLPSQNMSSLWPLPPAGHIQTTPSEDYITLKDACPPPWGHKWLIIHSDPSSQAQIPLISFPQAREPVLLEEKHTKLQHFLFFPGCLSSSQASLSFLSLLGTQSKLIAQ